MVLCAGSIVPKDGIAVDTPLGTCQDDDCYLAQKKVGPVCVVCVCVRKRE